MIIWPYSLRSIPQISYVQQSPSIDVWNQHRCLTRYTYTIYTITYVTNFTFRDKVKLFNLSFNLISSFCVCFED